MAQATHGSAPDIAGRGLANPVAMILSTGMLFDWLGSRHGDEELVAIAKRIDQAVSQAIADGTSTPDLGGTASTAAFTDAVVERLGP